MAKSKGSEFELSFCEFIKTTFEEMGYQVIEVRKQTSGTQNGFDVKVSFLDDDDNERDLFFECKDYDTQLQWSDILPKMIELEAANYNVDGFIAVSPKKNISNIGDNISPKFKEKFNFPISFWTPDSCIHDIFSLNPSIYKKVYGDDCKVILDKSNALENLKGRIDLLIKQKQLLRYVNRIEIKQASKTPSEDSSYITNLDKKLNEVLAVDDPDRLEYHKLRCDYKVFLEDLTDLNNSLRVKILKWQDNLRLKAKRLTKKFQDDEEYTPRKFFHQFFDEAEKELNTFYSIEKIDGSREKLLNGVIFELAAECPLDWRKKTDERNN